MDKKAKACSQHETICFLKTFVAVFVPILIVLIILHLFLYQGKKRHVLDVLTNVEVHRVALVAQSLVETFERVFADLNYLASRYLASSQIVDGADFVPAGIGEDFFLFTREEKKYDQIRILDRFGLEQLRINYNNGAPYIMPAGQRQDKSQRYYFKQCMALDPGEIYISPLDLNVEHGEVERPFKPIVRIGQPLWDSEGRKMGMLMLNYYGAHLLDLISDGATYLYQQALRGGGQIMLVNSQGYWLVAPDAEDEWGFMFADRKDRTFANRYPEEWRQIIAEDRGHLLTAHGFFAFSTVRPSLAAFRGGEGYFGKIISFVPMAHLERIIYPARSTFYLLAFLLVAAAVSVSLLVALLLGKKRRHKKELEYLAFTDPLTGLLNRRAFQQRLEQETDRVDRYGGQLFMILGDIDHFKKINDTHGHDAGDFILTKIAATLTANLRSTDVLCRWGGEEFMVLVSGKAPEDGKKVAEKLRKAVEDEVMSFKPRIQVTMSFGVCAYRPKMTMEDLIKCTDEMLYSAKRNGRNKVSFSGL